MYSDELLALQLSFHEFFRQEATVFPCEHAILFTHAAIFSTVLRDGN